MKKKARLPIEERRLQYLEKYSERIKAYNRKPWPEFTCCKATTDLILRAYGTKEL